MRYRVVEVEDGNGVVKFAIQYKEFLFWKYYKKQCSYICNECIELFDTYEEAKKTVDKWTWQDNSEKLKIKKIYNGKD